MKFSIQLGNFNFSFGGKSRDITPKRLRSFPGAQINRLTNDWQSPSTSADVEIKASLPTLIGRCRQLERGNDYVRRYLSLAENNILGAEGIGLQMKIKDPAGDYDKGANNSIELGWQAWGKRETASMNQRLSWRRVESLVLRSALRDGGALVRKIITRDNPYWFTLQPLEIDHLDNDLNRVIPGGNEIRMGVEINPDGRVVAYHIWTKHPGDQYQNARQRVAVSAADMIHVMLPERIAQTMGYPRLVSAMLRLNMLNGYEEAELIAARENACKGGFITKTVPEDFVGDAVDEQGNQEMEMEPGLIRELEPGQSFVEHDPKHPNTAYSTFVKGVLRGLSSGLGVSYTSLSNDLEGVNYSSIRAGLLEEREEWKTLQCWLIESLHQRVFDAWLEMALAAGALKLGNGSALPSGKFEKFSAAEWKPRRWPWVDPAKDIQANIESVNNGFSSRRRIIAEQGADVEDVFQEQAEDNKLAEGYDLEFPIDKPVLAAINSSTSDD